MAIRIGAGRMIYFSLPLGIESIQIFDCAEAVRLVVLEVAALVARALLAGG